MAQQKKVKYISTFTGYKNYRDILKLQPTDITAGSQNVWITDASKIETRAGMQFFGAQGTVGTATQQSWTLPHRIHSSYDEFVNNQGVKIPLRFYYSGTTAKGDVAEAYLPEYVAGVAQSTSKWYQITANAPAVPLASKHQIYFGQWFDPLNKQNQLVMTYGTTNVTAWTGGFAPITSITGTTITTNATWRSLGFIESLEGVNSIVVNGVTYALTSGDFSTNTITVASTTGISVNNLAFQTMRNDTIDDQTTATGFVADVCSVINNQVYYLDWRQKGGLVSWNRNQVSSLGVTSYQGTSGLNDAVFSGTYTGTDVKNIELTIDSVNPASETQEYLGTGSQLFFDTSAYSGVGENTYQMKCMYTQVITGKSLTYTGTFTDGEIIVGGTSGAVGIIYQTDPITINLVAGLYIISGQFQPNETVTGQASGATIEVFSIKESTGVSFTKNDVPVTSITWFGGVTRGVYQISLNTQPIDPTLTFVDGLVINFPDVVAMDYGDTLKLTINAGSADTFSWSINGANQATLVPITGSAQTLTNGISVTFVETTGHAIGDKWTVSAFPKVDRGWRQVYFTKPVRLAGEGFRFSLDSNGWALTPQENLMYVNAQGGEYYTIGTQLLESGRENLSVQRLKSEPQNKVLYPYLMSYIKDYLAVISQDKTYDILGRQKFLELPQTRTLSDMIRVDFESSDWEDAQILYFKRKIYFCLPKEGFVIAYDEYRKYWHPPHFFARRVSRLTIIDNKLIGHSYERNESYELYIGTNDLDIYPIEVRIVTGYQDENYHFDKKTSGAFACDGYIEGVPVINWTVNAGIGGCYGRRTGTIKPVLCIPESTASLGKSSLGKHGLGNNPVNIIPHFFYGKTYADISFYHRNIEFYCNSLDQRWALTSYGIDVERGKLTNSDIFNPPN